MKITEDCVYKKIGKRYIPIGVCEPIDYIPDGIWYIRHKKNSRAITNCSYLGEILKIGDKEDISLNIQCGLDDLCEEFLTSDEYKTLLKDDKFTINDLTHAIIKVIYTKYKK